MSEAIREFQNVSDNRRVAGSRELAPEVFSETHPSPFPASLFPSYRAKRSSMGTMRSRTFTVLRMQNRHDFFHHPNFPERHVP